MQSITLWNFVVNLDMYFSALHIARDCGKVKCVELLLNGRTVKDDCTTPVDVVTLAIT